MFGNCRSCGWLIVSKSNSTRNIHENFGDAIQPETKCKTNQYEYIQKGIGNIANSDCIGTYFRAGYGIAKLWGLCRPCSRRFTSRCDGYCLYRLPCGTNAYAYAHAHAYAYAYAYANTNTNTNTNTNSDSDSDSSSRPNPETCSHAYRTAHAQPNPPSTLVKNW
jgi:hypothetical protein